MIVIKTPEWRGRVSMYFTQKNLYKRLNDELASCNKLSYFSQEVLEELRKILKFEKGEIFIYNPESEELNLVAETGFDTGFNKCSKFIKLKIDDENPASMAIAENRIIHIRLNDSILENFQRLYSLSFDYEVFSIPLRANGEMVGVLQFFSKKGSEEEINSGVDLENLAEWLGMKMYCLKKSELLRNIAFRKLLEFAGDAAVIVDNKGIILEASESFYRLLGYTKGDLIRTNINELYKTRSEEETVLIRSNGTPLVCCERTEAITDEDGDVSGYIKIFNLIKELKSIEIEKKEGEILEQVRENLEYFELLADRLINPIAIIKSCLELKDEIEHDRLFNTILQQIERIDRVLNEFRERGKETFRIWKELDTQK